MVRMVHTFLSTGMNLGPIRLGNFVQQLRKCPLLNHHSVWFIGYCVFSFVGYFISWAVVWLECWLVK